LPHDKLDVACSEFIGLGGMIHVQLDIMYKYPSCSLQLLPCPKKKKYRHPLYPKNAGAAKARSRLYADPQTAGTQIVWLLEVFTCRNYTSLQWSMASW